MPIPLDYEFVDNLPFDNSIGMDAFAPEEKAPILQDVDDEFKKLNCYKGNVSLKGNKVQVPMTDEHIAEFKKCKNDIFYFLMNYGRIIDLDRGIVNFQLYQYQKNMIKLMAENRFVVNLLPRQMGKAVDEDTDVLTDSGFKKIKDIILGDKVYNANGNLVEVIAITGAQEDRECYEIEFSTGETVVADINHDWKFLDKSMNKYIVRNTKEMLERYEINKKQKQSISIDHCKPINFDSQEVKITPYDLGDSIPKEYIFNDLETRLELLRELMDNNGTIEKNGDCRFYHTNKNIVDDVKFLLSTLGIIATIEVVENEKSQKVYSLNFVCINFNVDELQNNDNKIYIKNYRKVENRTVYCLTVDDPEHLFLVGKTLIPTHNCSEKDTNIKIRNKTTGEIIELTIEEFYLLAKQKKEAQ